MSIKISVIIPIYNAQAYLSETLECIINQTLKPIEILCVDDGSSDQSVSIIKSYSKKDRRIRVLSQKENSDGAALARNLGIREAKGEYLCIIDADDLFDTDMLEKTYEIARKFDVDIVVFGASFYNTNTGEDIYSPGLCRFSSFPEEQVFSPTDYSRDLFQRFLGSAWPCLFKKSFIEEHDIAFYPVHVTDDIEFTYTAMACAKKITTIKRRFVHYRRNANNNQTSNLYRYPETGWKAFLHFKETLVKHHVYETYKVSYANLMLWMICETYLRSMISAENFENLFYKLKNGYLEKLGAFDIADSDYTDTSLVEKRNSIINDTPEEYLIKVNFKSSVSFNLRSFRLPYAYQGDKELNIVIYGAGYIGRGIFNSIMEEHDIHLSGWIDQNYLKYGYPVEPVDSIQYKKYDLVYIAIENKDICMQVKSDLCKLGVEKEKIYYPSV